MNVKIKGKLADINLDAHFTDATTSSQDKIAGNIISHVIGDTGIDFHTMNPSEQWQQIMKALRVHGFEIYFID